MYTNVLQFDQTNQTQKRLTAGSFGAIINTYTARNHMQYTLITGNGKVYTFFIRAVAEQYQQAYGGTVIDGTILVDKVIRTVV